MDPSLLLAFLSALCAGGIALTVPWQERRSLAHWAFSAVMAVLAVEALLATIGADAVLPDEIVSWQQWKFVTVSFLPGTSLLFSLTYARGNSREFLLKWRLPLLAAFVLPISLALFFRRGLVVSVQRADPTAPWLLALGAPGFVLYLVLLLSAILVLMNLERTFRAAVGTMRWRIKFMVLGLGLLFAVRAYTSSQVLLFHAVNLSLQSTNSAALLVACALILRSLWRTGHFEPSIYPSHSILENSFTVMLAGVYLVIVGVLARVVAFLGGDASFALKSFVVLVGLVLLTMLLLSDRVRLYTKRFVSRHFQRPLYDYRTVWRTFTEGTARRVEESDLCGAIVKLVSEIFQALSVTIWLVDARKEALTFAASTSLSESKAVHLKLDPADAAAVIAALSSQPGPIDLDSSKEPWAVALRCLQPDEFRKGGNRVAVPLSSGGELLGVLTLGDRVGGMLFTLQDLDLLKSVGDQAAASLLNIRLSQRLTQGKQLEAFQTMSAFFVHDLKNTASTLSLMLQNLPVHFNDPSFREDALRGISKTVSHINELIRRLSLLRQQVVIQPIESDLNKLVTEALTPLQAPADASAAPPLSPGERASLPSKGFAAEGVRGNQLSESSSPSASGSELSTFNFQLSTPSSQPSASSSQLATCNLQLATLEVALHPLPKLRLDPAQIQNVVTNLVLNAREAIGPGGQVRVETSQRNGCVLLAISDNGCGMTPEFIQDSLFRPFQTTKKQGLGIGMFQCKMIIEAHRGRIEVDSEPGKGTTFRVLLPLSPSSSPAAP